MPTLSFGLLMCRKTTPLEFFLVHPGGPYFRNKDRGVWSIPKGLPEGEETPLQTAKREFQEETGISPNGPFLDLGTVKQKGGKMVGAWAFEGDWDPASALTCNTFTLEWPPHSGKKVEFPEIDAASWFTLETAMSKINQAQTDFLLRATQKLL